ncbi:hypothetical protein [Actinoplanes sp. NPDC026670]|uniref:hypothetical protein n=1 Tax=Actinoplanes sp. NPDC026670 TaxID=3154700 RepID=UPI0033D9C418
MNDEKDPAGVLGYPFKSKFGRPFFEAGKAEGRAAGKARALFLVLSARGIEVSDEVRATIAACTDLEQLELWLRRAVVAERVEDLGGSLAG